MVPAMATRSAARETIVVLIRSDTEGHDSQYEAEIPRTEVSLKNHPLSHRDTVTQAKCQVRMRHSGKQMTEMLQNDQDDSII